MVGKALATCLHAVRHGWMTNYNPVTLTSSLDDVMRALQLFATNCPFMREYLNLTPFPVLI